MTTLWKDKNQNVLSARSNSETNPPATTRASFANVSRATVTASLGYQLITADPDDDAYVRVTLSVLNPRLAIAPAVLRWNASAGADEYTTLRQFTVSALAGEPDVYDAVVATVESNSDAYANPVAPLRIGVAASYSRRRRSRHGRTNSQSPAQHLINQYMKTQNKSNTKSLDTNDASHSLHVGGPRARNASTFFMVFSIPWSISPDRRYGALASRARVARASERSPPARTPSPVLK